MVDVEQVLDRNRKAFNARDMDGYLANQTPDVSLILPGGITLSGRDEMKGYVGALWEAFPDGRLTFGDQVLSEDAAATELVFTGTHSGPLETPTGPIAPTGKKVSLHSVSLLRIKDGHVASERNYGDSLELMAQLGLAGGPGPGEQL